MSSVSGQSFMDFQLCNVISVIQIHQWSDSDYLKIHIHTHTHTTHACTPHKRIHTRMHAQSITIGHQTHWWQWNWLQQWEWQWPNSTDCYHGWSLVSTPWTRPCGLGSNLITSISWDGLACYRTSLQSSMMRWSSMLDYLMHGWWCQRVHPTGGMCTQRLL